MIPPATVLDPVAPSRRDHPTPVPPTSPPGDVWVLATLIFCSASIVVGLLWDISWHMSIGRDTLWSPPHVLEQVGAALAGLACGALVLRTTFGGDEGRRGRSVAFWGFRGPLGAWTAIWGSFAMAFSVPFDDWWHNAYGLDVVILSPPHLVLLSGMVAIQVGAMMLALGFQNRAPDGSRRRFGWTFAFAAAALTAMVMTAASEYVLRPNVWHGSSFYIVTAAAFGFLVVGIARAGRLRFPATSAMALCMAIFLVPQWILVQFPATPRLSPIVNPITTMQAFGFPLLLVAPALAVDLVLARLRGASDWVLAPLLGIVFMAATVAAHWPVATFLVRSPLADSALFAADHWGYFNAPGDYVDEFWDPSSGASLARGLLLATLVAMAAARIGLWWGAWMRRVRR